MFERGGKQVRLHVMHGDERDVERDALGPQVLDGAMVHKAFVQGDAVERNADAGTVQRVEDTVADLVGYFIRMSFRNTF